MFNDYNSKRPNTSNYRINNNTKKFQYQPPPQSINYRANLVGNKSPNYINHYRYEQEEQTQQWSNDRKQASVVLLRMKQADEQALNELLYEVALFNFSQFLIRDFELQKMPILGEGCALRVSGFADMDEADWWIGLVRKDAHMQAVLIGIDVLPVAEVNLPLVK